ncbi:ABC transporter permease [Mycoplasma sp. Ms02]|uniref:ABC transporter permease n=1 Tax=Mycoplasma sp. Ms02 TaxID=353851 RepID=UPI002102E02D|nr:ABC transporter permease [Mycoplasma sp. Ms02]
MAVAHFSDNPFLQGVTSSNLSEGSKKVADQAAAISSAYEKSIQYHYTYAPSGGLEEHLTDWHSYKVNEFSRFLYWIQSAFNSERPFGLVVDTKLLSVSNVKTIPELTFKYLKYSIWFTLPSFLISATLGIALGILAGYKRGKIIDSIINAFSLVFSALPSFVIAPIAISLILYFAPTAHYKFIDPSKSEIFSTWDQIKAALPAISIIVLGSLSGYITYTRNQVISALTSNYVLIAKTKGLSTVQIFFKYVLRNISIPLAAALIPSYIGLLSGGIILETYFGVPGISRVFADSFTKSEINLIMFNTVFFTFLSLMTVIVVDISYAILDPRIKLASSSQAGMIYKFKAWIKRRKLYDLNQKDHSLEKGGE